MNLIEGLTFLIIGLIVAGYNFYEIEPLNFDQNGLLISTYLNPTFVFLFMAGFFFMGAGAAQAAVTFTIYKLEKDLAEKIELREN